MSCLFSGRRPFPPGGVRDHGQRGSGGRGTIAIGVVALALCLPAGPTRAKGAPFAETIARGEPSGLSAGATLAPPTANENAGAAELPPTDAKNRALVAVVGAAGMDAACQEIVTRVIAELMADGIPVVALTCAEGDRACPALQGMRVSATVTVQKRAGVRTVEVRTAETSSTLAERSPPSLVAASDAGQRRRAADGDAVPGPAALAIRTVELLKAMLIEASVLLSGSVRAESGVTQKPDGEPAATAIAASAPRAAVFLGRRNITLTVGALVLPGMTGLRAAYGPTLSVGRRTSEHALLSLVIAGPSFSPDQRHEAVTASVRQEMAALQFDLLGPLSKSVFMRTGIAGGVYHLHVNGQTTVDVPLVNGALAGRSGSGGGFAWLLSWSAGVVANIRPDVGIYLDGRLFILTPTPVVMLNGVEIGRTGNPGVALSSGVEMRF